MEMSVAMKRNLFLFALLLAIPAFTAAQSQTRERRSDDSEPPRTGANAVRNRVVGSTRAANHVEKSTAVTASKDKSGSSSVADPKSSTPVNQIISEPKWGNTAVVVRSARNERIAPPDNSLTDKQKVPGQDNKSVKKLVQQTALVTESAVSSPVAGNASSPKPLATRGPASTVVYHVGIGDVLDIRLSNLPTRESTLFTVLKNGSLEYPLLSGPLAVAGMTTDEIAKLLTNEIKVIKTARVSVSVRDYASHTVVITGLVDSPGRKIMRREAMPLFAVLAEALPRPEASLGTIVRNGNNQTVSLSNEQAMSTLVLPGDVIKISGGNSTPTRFVYVGGDVVSRGEKEFREGMTLTQAILSAGGVARSSKTSVKVARRNSNGFLMSNEYSLQSILEGKSQDPLLQAGDRIEVTRGM
jgi:protein involved in polysaccharide export with SLBB domain